MIKLSDLQNTFPQFSYHFTIPEEIRFIAQLNPELKKNELAWCSDKNKEQLKSIKEGSLIISKESFDWITSEKLLSTSVNYIVTDNPRRAFLKIMQEFFVPQKKYGLIENSAYIDKTVDIQKEYCIIGHNVVIGANCKIGKHVEIGSNTVILDGTIIDDCVKIGNNNTIGGVGFGYEKDEEGNYELIPHIGNVHIMEHAEIGNNNCIDRAVIGSTLIEKNVKIDNLTHIAHGVILRENCLIIANAMIGGSTEIGKNVWVAPSTSIMQKVKIGDDSIIGLAAVVLKDVEPRSVMVGNPAKKIKSI